MMMKQLYLSLFVFLFLGTSAAYGQCGHSHRPCSPSRTSQEPPKYQRLTLIAGGGPQYTLDAAGPAFPSVGHEANGLQPATTAQRLNWQGFGFLGYRFNGGYRAPQAFGLFGTYGQFTPQAITEVNALQGIVNPLPAQGSVADFREIEAGFLIRNWLRLSAGIGEQRFVDDNGLTHSQQYYSTTTGIHLPMSRNLVAFASVTTRFGRDFEAFTFRPNAGLAFQLRAIRI